VAISSINPNVAKSNSYEPGRTIRKGFEVNLLTYQDLWTVSLSEVTKRGFPLFPLNLLKTAIRSLEEWFGRVYFYNGRVNSTQSSSHDPLVFDTLLSIVLNFPAKEVSPTDL